RRPGRPRPGPPRPRPGRRRGGPPRGPSRRPSRDTPPARNPSRPGPRRTGRARPGRRPAVGGAGRGAGEDEPGRLLSRGAAEGPLPVPQELPALPRGEGKRRRAFRPLRDQAPRGPDELPETGWAHRRGDLLEDHDRSARRGRRDHAGLQAGDRRGRGPLEGGALRAHASRSALPRSVVSPLTARPWRTTYRTQTGSIPPRG